MIASHIYCDHCGETMRLKNEVWQFSEDGTQKWRDLCCELGHIVATISIIVPEKGCQ